MITVRLFGKFTVLDANGVEIPIAGEKTRGLLAFLALNAELPPTRDRIISLFWGDRFREQARQSLRQAVTKLRRILAHPDGVAISVDQDRIALNPEFVDIDVERFVAAAASDDPEATRRAVALFTGPILEGVYGLQPEFEDWVALEQQRINDLAVKVLERAAEIELQAGQQERALGHARRLAEIDPWSDAAQMPLIRILAQKGDRAAAVQHFKAYAEALNVELGIAPAPALTALVDEVKGNGFFGQDPSDETSAPVAAPAGRDVGRTRVAVVPFAWLSSEADSGFLVDSLVEDVATKLSRFSWLEVTASLAVMGNRPTAAEMEALAAESDLDYLVHGSLRVHGSKLRLTVQLVDPKTGRYLWVERYTREAEDPFDVQDDLTDTVAGSMEAVLERVVGRVVRTVSFEEMNAWECYHRGLDIQYEFDARTNCQAQAHFRRAIALDPTFGLAYARLSYAIVISVIYFEAEDVERLLSEALEHAETAARLEPEDAVARFALGRVHLARGEYGRSIADLRAAIDLNPRMAQAHCGLGDSMAYSGDVDTAMRSFEEAVRLSPTDPYRWAFLSYGAMALLFKGAFKEAAYWAAEAEAMPNAHYWPIAIRTSALAHGGRLSEARASLAELRRRRPGITCDFVRERLFYLRDPAQVDTYVAGLKEAGLA